MTSGNFSVQRIAYYLICLCIVLVMLYVGQAFFIPIAFGIFLAFLLKPLRDWFERFIPSRVVAILLSYLSILVLLTGVFSFFAFQIREVVTSADNIVASLAESGNVLSHWCGSRLGWTDMGTPDCVTEHISSLFAAPLGILTTGISTSGFILTNFVLVIIYAFFFLLYSTAFKRFVLGQFTNETQFEGMQTLREIQSVASGYLGGMLMVMLVLGVLNTLGLYLIGIRYALLWGFLGALLAVIPYIGTLLGGLLPVLYAVATTGTVWQPVAIIILYGVVQTVEGNLITPKVVGKSVKINALAAVLAIIFGAFFWGFAGLILAIPILAMLRIVMEHSPALQPVALLLSDDLYDHSMRFLGDYNQPKHRISSFLQKKPVSVRQVRSSRKGGKPADGSSDPDAEVITDTKAE
ncbi:MAG: AI-2E family transporter [Bacteroidota bacterium]